LRATGIKIIYLAVFKFRQEEICYSVPGVIRGWVTEIRSPLPRAPTFIDDRRVRSSDLKWERGAGRQSPTRNIFHGYVYSFDRQNLPLLSDSRGTF